MSLAYSSLITSCNFGRDVPFEATKITTLKPVIKPFLQRTKVAAVSEDSVVRRSGDYQPCIWDYNFFQSLKTDYTVTSIKKKLLYLSVFCDAMNEITKLL